MIVNFCKQLLIVGGWLLGSVTFPCDDATGPVIPVERCWKTSNMGHELWIFGNRQIVTSNKSRERVNFSTIGIIMHC